MSSSWRGWRAQALVEWERFTAPRRRRTPSKLRGEASRRVQKGPPHASATLQAWLLHESDRRWGGTWVLLASDHSLMDLPDEKNSPLLSRLVWALGGRHGG